MSLGRTDRPGAFMIVQAESLGEAKDRLERLPFVSEGLMTLDFEEVIRL
jgi:hypothetical protein